MTKVLLVMAACVVTVAIIVRLIRYFHDGHAWEGRLGPAERERVIARHARANVRAVEAMLARRGRVGRGRHPRREPP